ncbi:PstS family phosphate ABC transporter substrate-binding protein [Cardiobacterium hominis]|uniref:PstS family phosphate ABC transporter substrate-binding protein n=1 Tax=Cardiobacterium hominis TaxID=2718 RepID=UPI0028D62186|nr:substrate-binding domain-containing protein [Cardiobacterium hominis]
MSQTPKRSGWYTFLFILGLLALLAGSFSGFLTIIFIGIAPAWTTLGFPVLLWGYIYLWACGYKHPLFGRKTCLAWLAILSGAGVAVLYPLGHELYREYLHSISVPAEINQWQYNPQDADNKLAKLDVPATLTLQAPYPKLDGSTALYPIYAAFAQATYPLKAGEYYSDYVDLSKTGEAYERLFAGQVDIIFVPAPSKAHQAKARELGIELHLTPIGKEAFVFFVNAKNPVDGLSVAQIRQIYSGSLTNWREVGGRDQRIRAFQRPENSGSQTALQKIMGDTPLQAAPREDVAAGMGGIINRVSDYYNFSDAIGYSFLFYSTQMTAKKEIKLLQIDGIPPTTPTSGRATTPSPTTSTPSPSSAGKTTTYANCSPGYNRRRDKSWCKKPATYRSPNPQPTLKKSQP